MRQMRRPLGHGLSTSTANFMATSKPRPTGTRPCPCMGEGVRKRVKRRGLLSQWGGRDTDGYYGPGPA